MDSASITSRFALDVQGFESLKRQAATNPDESLKAAAEQFEAIFIGMMLKSMREASPGGGLLQSSQGDMYQGMLDQQYSQHLAGKGVGLADMLVDQLRTANTAPAGEQIPRAAASTLPTGTVSGLNGQPSDANQAVEFVRKHRVSAIRAGVSNGISPNLILAQAALETGWGRNTIPTSDGTDSFNLFGIKADRQWAGPTTTVVTHEYDGGKKIASRAVFKVYESHQEAFDDYAALVGKSERYADVRASRSDDEAADAIQRAGYATDPDYAAKLKQIMRGLNDKIAAR